jgi:hypothetical protein
MDANKAISNLKSFQRVPKFEWFLFNKVHRYHLAHIELKFDGRFARNQSSLDLSGNRVNQDFGLPESQKVRLVLRGSRCCTVHFLSYGGKF